MRPCKPRPRAPASSGSSRESSFIPQVHTPRRCWWPACLSLLFLHLPRRSPTLCRPFPGAKALPAGLASGWEVTQETSVPRVAVVAGVLVGCLLVSAPDTFPHFTKEAKSSREPQQHPCQVEAALALLPVTWDWEQVPFSV